MKLATIVLVLFVVLMTGSLSTRADDGNPFGFETNTHPLKYEYCKKDKNPKHYGLRNHGYECSSAPRPHPEFHHYLLEFVEDVGLCRIFGYSNTFPWDDKLLKFKLVKNQVTNKYGPSTSKSRPDHHPVYFWSADEGFKGVGDVKAILLEAAASGSDLKFQVIFSLRSSQCQKALNDKADRAF